MHCCLAICRNCWIHKVYKSIAKVGPGLPCSWKVEEVVQTGEACKVQDLHQALLAEAAGNAPDHDSRDKFIRAAELREVLLRRPRWHLCRLFLHKGRNQRYDTTPLLLQCLMVECFCTISQCMLLE